MSEIDDKRREFASWMASLRESSGAGTQQQAADRIGVGRTAVARWETGVALPDAKNFQGIADAYHVKVSDIQERIGNTAPGDTASDWSASLSRRLQRQTRNFTAAQRAALERGIDSMIAIASQQ